MRTILTSAEIKALEQLRHEWFSEFASNGDVLYSLRSDLEKALPKGGELREHNGSIEVDLPESYCIEIFSLLQARQYIGLISALRHIVSLARILCSDLKDKVSGMIEKYHPDMLKKEATEK